MSTFISPTTVLVKNSFPKLEFMPTQDEVTCKIFSESIEREYYDMLLENHLDYIDYQKKLFSPLNEYSKVSLLEVSSEILDKKYEKKVIDISKWLDNTIRRFIKYMVNNHKNVELEMKIIKKTIEKDPLFASKKYFIKSIRYEVIYPPTSLESRICHKLDITDTKVWNNARKLREDIFFNRFPIWFIKYNSVDETRKYIEKETPVFIESDSYTVKELIDKTEEFIKRSKEHYEKIRMVLDKERQDLITLRTKEQEAKRNANIQDEEYAMKLESIFVNNISQLVDQLSVYQRSIMRILLDSMHIIINKIHDIYDDMNDKAKSISMKISKYGELDTIKRNEGEF